MSTQVPRVYLEATRSDPRIHLFKSSLPAYAGLGERERLQTLHALLDDGSPGAGSKLDSGVVGRSPVLLPRAAGLSKVMMGPRHLLGQAPKASLGCLTRHPSVATASIWHAGYPPLPTVNAPLDAGVLIQADCAANRWSTTCSISWAALEMAVLKVSLTRAWTKCSALRFSSDMDSSGRSGAGLPSELSAMAAKLTPLAQGLTLPTLKRLSPTIMHVTLPHPPAAWN